VVTPITLVSFNGTTDDPVAGLLADSHGNSLESLNSAARATAAKETA
jgi:hypothetical protein